MPDSITCPRCHAAIPLTDALSHQVEERLRREFDAASRATEAAYTETLAAKEAELDAKLTAVRTEAEAGAATRAEENISTELSDLKARVAEQAGDLATAKANELALLKEKRDLQDRQDALELEVARKLDEERGKLVATTTERLEEEHRLRIREKDLTLEQMGKRIEDLRAAADPKRSGLQGEVFEREIEDILIESFPRDVITPVKAGKRGADVLQQVRSPRGLDCGALLWESKNAKHWSSSWVDKLKTDQKSEGAEIAILVSAVLPDGVQRMALHDGVWVSDFGSAVALAGALRLALIEISQARSVEANRTQALDALYEYLCSKDFQHRIAGTVEATLHMKNDLDAERRAMERIWAKRERQIDLVMRNSAGMYGELQAIVGDALQPVSTLELTRSTDTEDDPLALTAPRLDEAA